MSGTDRNHHLDIPLWTRMSDVKSFAQCQLQWFLTYVNEPVLPDATYFALGTACHETIEWVCNTPGATLVEAVAWVHVALNRLMNDSPNGWIETSRRPNDRAELLKIATLGVTRFFDEVHPDGEHRMPVYEQYEWPPRVEVVYYAQSDALRFPIRSEVDAIFTPKKGKVQRIVDWKFGSTAKADPVQLWGYHYGLNRDPESGYKQYTFDGHFHHFLAAKTGGKLEQVGPYPGDHAIERRIAWVEQQKLLGQTAPAAAFPPVVEWYCNYCRVQDFCPVYAGPEAESDLQGLLESGNINWVEAPNDHEELQNGS